MAYRTRMSCRKAAAKGEGNMRIAVIILTAFVVVTGGVLALMNNACKTSRYSWCAPKMSVAPHDKDRRV
jgi:hypothetical protein